MRKILFLLAACGTFLLTGCVNTGQGSHTGNVTAVETNGILFKTIRAYFKSDLRSSQEDTYCVEDEEVATKLRQYSDQQKTVTIRFHDELVVGFWRCEDGDIAIIDSVEVK